MFQTQAKVERYEASSKFFICMMEENSSVSEHVFKMSGYGDRLARLGGDVDHTFAGEHQEEGMMQ